MKKPIALLSSVLFLSIGILNAQLPAAAPGGVYSPEVWFMTVPTDGNNLQGSYKWQDFGGDNVKLLRADQTEFTVLRDSIHTYNFNPALYFLGSDNKVITLDKAGLSQASIIGVWGFKQAKQKTDGFLYHVDREENDPFLLTKKTVVHTMESGKEALNYTPNFIGKPVDERIQILSYSGSNRRGFSVWGDAKKTTIRLGAVFSGLPGAFDPEKFDGSDARGYCPELIVYNRVLSNQERLRVESYLAVKYGITLDSSYYNSQGARIWDRTANKDYNHRITGYMRDDASGLFQRTSTTSYEEKQLTIDDTYENNNSYLPSSPFHLLVMGWQEGAEIENEHYVLFGDNGKPTSIRPEDKEKDTTQYRRMERVWMLQTNINSAVCENRIELSGKLTADSLFGKYANGHVYLLKDRSGTGNFDPDNTDYIPMDEWDAARSKIIFNNVCWDGLTGNLFTFAVKGDSIHPDLPDTVTNYPFPVRQPSCAGSIAQSDGRITIINGMRYKLIDIHAGTAVENTCMQQDCDISNLPVGTYTLITTPVSAPASQFNFQTAAAGAWAVSNGTFNNAQSYCHIEWTVADLHSDTKVAMMLADNYHTPLFNYGVRIVGDKLYTINPSGESTAFVTIGNAGEPIRMERNGNTITVKVNNEAVAAIAINISDAGKGAYVAVQAESGAGVRNLSTSNFNFYSQSQGELWHTAPAMQVTTPSSQTYTVVLEDTCSGSNPVGSGNLTLTPVGSNTFNAHLTLPQAQDGMIYVYYPNGVVCANSEFTDSDDITHTFNVQAPGFYFVNVVLESGRMISDKIYVW